MRVSNKIRSKRTARTERIGKREKRRARRASRYCLSNRKWRTALSCVDARDLDATENSMLQSGSVPEEGQLIDSVSREDVRAIKLRRGFFQIEVKHVLRHIATVGRSVRHVFGPGINRSIVQTLRHSFIKRHLHRVVIAGSFGSPVINSGISQKGTSSID